MEARAEEPVHRGADSELSDAVPGNVVIERLELKDILSFGPDSPPVELGPLNVMIGPNASGKSNLIRVLHLLSGLPTGELLRVPDGSLSDDWIRRGKHVLLGGEIKAALPDANTPLTYELKIRSVDGELEVLSEHVFAGETKVLGRSEFISAGPSTLIYGKQNIPLVVEVRRSALSLGRPEPLLI